MANTQTKTQSSARSKLWIDVFIFLAFLVTMDPRSSGISVHEWLAISIIAVLVVHLLLNWDWITQTTRRLLGKMGMQARLNYILNWLLFLDGTLIMASGIMISQVAMPMLGIHLPRSFSWRGLHSLSTNLFLVLLGFHTALHWTWVVNSFSRYVFQPIARLFTAKKQKDASV